MIEDFVHLSFVGMHRNDVLDANISSSGWPAWMEFVIVYCLVSHFKAHELLLSTLEYSRACVDYVL